MTGRRKSREAHLVAVLGLVLFSQSAVAREDEIEPTLPPPPPPATGEFNLGVGIAGTTDYVSHGITQSDSRPALKGYIEPSYGLGPVLGDAFVNVWSSNVDFGNDRQGAEIDVTGGLKPKFLGPQWAPQIGYVHFFYAPADVSPHYGELFAKTDYTFGKDDRYTLRALIFFAPDFSQTDKTATWIAGGGRVKPWKNVGVYAGLGYQFFEKPNTRAEQLAWTAGISYYWKSVTFDLRYWDTNLTPTECVIRSGFADGCDARVVGTISLDTTWTALLPRG